MTPAIWALYRATWHAVLKTNILWGERMYQHRLTGDATAPWELT